jgi:hypothetical protein
LQQVRAVDAGGVDLDQDFARARPWRIAGGRLQDLRAAGLGDLDGSHVAGRM